MTLRNGDRRGQHRKPDRRTPGRAAGFAAVVLLLAACSSNPAPTPPAPRSAEPEPEPAPAIYQEGIASWYGPGFDGRPTASGEIFDADSLTAAHPSLPFGSIVRVINVENGREVVVRINDRGPFVEGRIIDVSQAAARALGMIGAGIARVRLILQMRASDSDDDTCPFCSRARAGPLTPGEEAGESVSMATSRVETGSRGKGRPAEARGDSDFLTRSGYS